MAEISVIIPVYKTEQYIGRCIESVQNQTFEDFELILVDDGSPDNCGRICDEYAEKDYRIKVIHQENAGVSSARNHGIEQAKGKYIVFIDSDDWVGPNYLNDLCKPEADFVSHSFSTIDEKGQLIKKQKCIFNRCILNRDTILQLLNDGILGYTFSKRFTLELIRDHKIRFEKTIDHTEDTLFIVNYLQLAKTAEIDDKDNYFYVRYDARITLSNQPSIDRLAMICTANTLICKKFYQQGSAEFEKLYYSRIGYSYMSYVGRTWCCNVKGVLQKYFFVCCLLKNEDVIKIKKYSPDALWKLPVHEKIIQACHKGNKLSLFYACLFDSLSKWKNQKRKK